MHWQSSPPAPVVVVSTGAAVVGSGVHISVAVVGRSVGISVGISVKGSASFPTTGILKPDSKFKEKLNNFVKLMKTFVKIYKQLFLSLSFR